MINNRLQVFVEGIPAPQGSMNSFPFKRKDGSIGVSTTCANKNTEPWREKVERKIRSALIEKNVRLDAEDPLILHVVFSFPVPKSKVKKKSGYPLYPITKPDVDKLGRAVSDALMFATGIDDSHIVQMTLLKAYVPDMTEAGALITVEQLEQRHSGE